MPLRAPANNTGVDASAGRAVLARQAAIAEQTISRGQLHRDASGFERMPLEKTRLGVFVEGGQKEARGAGPLVESRSMAVLLLLGLGSWRSDMLIIV